MVATRNHPKEFPPPSTSTSETHESPVKRESPAKRSSRSTTTSSSAAEATTSATETVKKTTRKSLASASETAAAVANHVSTRANATSPTRALREATSPIRNAPARVSRTLSSAATGPRGQAAWSHTPSNLTLIWLAISLPLVLWDMGYVLLRPYSMPGGFLHAPLWKPYALYGTVDYVYGIKAIQDKNGWTLAQTSVNVVETAVYAVYLALVYMYGQEEEERQGRGAPDKNLLGRLRALGNSRTVHGRMAAWVVVLGFATANVTFWKTVLYWLLEAFSDFANIGHNDATTLLFLWIIPNGAWIVLPAYMIYVFGREILQGLEIAATTSSRKYR